MSLKTYRIDNIVDVRCLLKTVDVETFTSFVKHLYKENEETNVNEPLSVEDCVKYVENYCDNLILKIY